MPTAVESGSKRSSKTNDAAQNGNGQGAEQLMLALFPENRPESLVVAPGDQDVFTLGMPVVAVTFGKQAGKKAVDLTPVMLFAVCDREGAAKKPKYPEIVVVEQEARPRPFSLDTLSGGGQIDSPVVVFGDPHGMEDRQRYAFADFPKDGESAVKRVKTIGGIDLGGYYSVWLSSVKACLIPPPVTFLDVHSVEAEEGNPFSAEYQRGRVWVRRYDETERNRHKKRKQKVFGIEGGQRRFEIPQIPYRILLSATKSAEYEDDED